MLFVIGLILPAPRGELLLRGKGSAPTAPQHNTIQLGSQALDKVSNGPAFPDVFLKVDHTKSILRFDIRFMAGPFRKEGAGHGQKHSGGTNRRLFSDDTPPDGWRSCEKGLQGAGTPLSWPEVGTCGITFYPTVKLFAHPVRPQSGEYAAVHSADCAG